VLWLSSQPTPVHTRPQLPQIHFPVILSSSTREVLRLEYHIVRLLFDLVRSNADCYKVDAVPGSFQVQEIRTRNLSTNNTCIASSQLYNLKPPNSLSVTVLAMASSASTVAKPQGFLE
jgi:dynactin complex subunit